MADENEYDLKPPEKPSPAPSNPGSPDLSAESASSSLKPGDPGWVPPEVVIEKADAEEVEEETPPDPDIEKHKGLAVLAYVCFLIPLVLAPNSKFARYHANQGLLAFLLLVTIVVGVTAFEVALWLVARFVKIEILSWFFSCGFHLMQIAMLVGWVVLVIYGIIHAANGEEKPLPVVGHWTLIK